ncbi:unnamed protein product [Spirodela intermedia]|uniref:RING-type E3 ubiquitin transferase BRCA1 n=1 Tax=Spirodela intermedia TaxID=51605 RepID=A0A7I8JQS6_SPIIN|nr:unnamed protein product [Spirodela intermedia]CAA6672490.1 unnamed protein product [Spirodela intermedia]
MENGSSKRRLVRGSRDLIFAALAFFVPIFRQERHILTFFCFLIYLYNLTLFDSVLGSECCAAEGMENVISSVSGYHGRERFKLIKLITQTGAHYVGPWPDRLPIWLVCWELDGNKYNLARSFGTKIVSHRWFEDCLKKGRRVPERPYLMQRGKSRECQADVLFDLSNTFDDARNQGNSSRHSENEVPRSRLLDKPGCASISRPHSCGQKTNLCDRIENSESTERKSRKLRRRSRTADFTVHAVLEVNRRAEISYLRDISDSDSISSDDLVNRQVPSPENNSDETSQAADGLEDIVELNSFPDPNEITPQKQHGKCGMSQREDRETSPSIDPFRSPAELSCGVLACGHRFCYTCIKGWADCMASKRKVSTCPLCKASFSSITKVDSAASSDQKIYSQTLPPSFSSDAADICLPPNDLDSFIGSQASELV